MRAKYFEDTYPVDIRMGFLIAILFFILIFLFVPRPEVKPYQLKQPVPTEVVQIWPEKGVEFPPKQKRPDRLLPVEGDEADIATIEPTVGDEVIPVKPTTQLPIVPFYAVEKKPKLIHSFPPKYPEVARQLGMEGLCVVEVIIGTDGRVRAAKIARSSGYEILDQAALEAVYGYRFSPAQQRDKLVEVRMFIPIRFQLQ
ncbi:hypothetical protein DRP53_10180 [candidate division WOR-3 bacterium]|uniref:TonB C-terminal domain-containing protein n=1 Tax=candidate division WOR-3 bacterium TaxID=2052148 RepID=A0A660SDS1_UNCW3|nr:MAG: hypothetical protein DRP53_10180 [candidate division WOR-3 bacterium]